MILDTSALVAILFNEADAALYANEIAAAADACKLSAANFVETSLVVESQIGPVGLRELDALIRRGGIKIEAVTEEQAFIARQAFTDYGKGRHPAALNFGDCFAYALAKASREPLLFKGRDFRETDVAAAL